MVRINKILHDYVFNQVQCFNISKGNVFIYDKELKTRKFYNHMFPILSNAESITIRKFLCGVKFSVHSENQENFEQIIDEILNMNPNCDFIDGKQIYSNTDLTNLTFLEIGEFNYCHGVKEIQLPESCKSVQINLDMFSLIINCGNIKNLGVRCSEQERSGLLRYLNENVLMTTLMVRRMQMVGKFTLGIFAAPSQDSRWVGGLFGSMTRIEQHQVVRRSVFHALDYLNSFACYEKDLSLL